MRDHYSVEFELSPDNVYRGMISVKTTDKGRVFHDMTQIEKVPASVSESSRILNRDLGDNISHKTQLSISRVLRWEALLALHTLSEKALLDAVLLSEGSDRDGNPNLVIRRFAAPFLTEDGIVADAFLTLKESFDKEDSVRIYSLELTEIKMPSERAAANDKSSDYRTDGLHNLMLKREKVKKAIENEGPLFRRIRILA